MLKPGSKAPEFVLANDQGGETSLSDLLQSGPLILYFYPADFTPGCTKEACSIRDIHNDIQAVGLQVAHHQSGVGGVADRVMPGGGEGPAQCLHVTPEPSVHHRWVLPRHEQHAQWLLLTRHGASE